VSDKAELYDDLAGWFRPECVSAGCILIAKCIGDLVSNVTDGELAVDEAQFVAAMRSDEFERICDPAQVKPGRCEAEASGNFAELLESDGRDRN